MSSLLTILGKNVRKHRAAQGFSQREFAKHSGIDNGDISKIENGKINISVLYLERIAKQLGVKMEELLY